jgi:succinate dehydrogenase / fumarate reductase membrane anchor subunit
VKFAFTGLAAWWVQRASAIYMLVFIVFLLGAFALHPLHSYPEWRAWVASPGVSSALLVFFAALLSHMWVGLRDVLLDYARPAGVRHVLLGLLAVGLLGTAAWVVWLLVRLQA